MKVAITGATGFVGNRIVEKFYLGKLHEVVPLARSNSSLALLARFNLPWKVCNHYSTAELTAAFEGCDAVVHTALGDEPERMAEAVYTAAEKNRVRRLVILSSASVYNQNPTPGTTEESPLPKKLATAYNEYKISSDKAFRNLRSKGNTELTFLMPGIVYGPRSRWIANLADQIIDGTAYLVAGGKGICNLIYVDNLIEAISLSLVAKGIDREGFFVSDAETVTWEEFYRPVGAALGVAFEKLHFVDPPVFTTTIQERFREQIQNAVATRRVQRIKPYVHPGMKKVYKRAMSLASYKPEGEVSQWTILQEKTPEVTLEMSLLQQCSYKLPNAKAERLLHYFPTVPFAEGMKRSISWLKFAGYPVD
jgi:2-alkyl-3-oxoalkanoate reductase